MDELGTKNLIIAAIVDGDSIQLESLISSRGPKYLEQWKKGYHCLCSAIRNDKFKVAKVLLSHNCDVNAVNASLETPLNIAAEKGKLSLCKKILSRGAYLNTRDKAGCTALHHAVRFGHKDVVKFLLSKKALVDVCDKGGKTPLIKAVENGHLELVPMLLSHGALVGTQDKAGRTALQVAVSLGYSSTVELLLTQKVCIDIRDDKGRTALHIAIEKENVHFVPTLIEHGASVNVHDKTGRTPLHIAVELGFESVVKLLLKKGAVVDVFDNAGISPLFIAFDKERRTIVPKLLDYFFRNKENDADSSPLRVAVKCGEFSTAKLHFTEKTKIGKPLSHALLQGKSTDLATELVESGGSIGDPRNNDNLKSLLLAVRRNDLAGAEFFLKAGVDVNAAASNESPPLYAAMDSGSNKMCKLLLKFKALANFSDRNGKSLLHLAIERHRYEIAELLLHKDVDVNKQTKHGITPLYIAANYGLRKMCALLLKHKADANIADLNGNAPLHLAVSRSRTTAKILVQNNADVNMETDGGRTPNLIAANYADVKMCKLLLKFGANSNVSDINGKSPLHLATELHHYDYAKLLLIGEANVNLKMKDGSTPLCIATNCGNKKMCQLLLNFGADATICDGNGKSPLHFAVEKNRCDLAGMLLDCRADANAKTIENVTPLYLSAMRGQEQMFKLLLKHGAQIDKRMKEEINAVLLSVVNKGCLTIAELILKHCVVEEGQFHDLFKTTFLKNGLDHKFTKLFVDHGFHISQSDVNDNHFVSVVVRNGYVKLLGDLIKYGLDVNMLIEPSGSSNERILHAAVKYKQKDITEMLLTYGAIVDVINGEKSPLVYAVENADSEILTLLLLMLVDINSSSDSFNSAVWLGLPEMMNVFLKFGYDVNHKGVFGKTALHYTADKTFCKSVKPSNEEGRREAAKLLLSKGADIEAAMHGGMTTFIMAINSNDLLLADILLQHDSSAVVNAVMKGDSVSLSKLYFLNLDRNLGGYFQGASGKPHCSALHIAVAKNNWELIKLLLKYNVNVDAQDKEGITPLHIAVWRGNTELVETLINSGADLNKKDENGVTPVFIAALERHARIFCLLVNIAADINVVDRNGRTLLFYMQIAFSGSEYEHEEEMERILEHNIVRMSVANLFISEWFLNSPMTRVLSDFWEKCELEVGILMSLMAEESGFSMYDVMTSSVHQLVAHLDTEITFFETEDWRSQIPIYEGIIYAKLKVAKHRKKLLDSAKPIIITMFPSLSDYSCFTNEDLLRFIYVYRFEQAGCQSNSNV